MSASLLVFHVKSPQLDNKVPFQAVKAFRGEALTCAQKLQRSPSLSGLNISSMTSTSELNVILRSLSKHERAWEGVTLNQACFKQTTLKTLLFSFSSLSDHLIYFSLPHLPIRGLISGFHLYGADIVFGCGTQCMNSGRHGHSSKDRIPLHSKPTQSPCIAFSLCFFFFFFFRTSVCLCTGEFPLAAPRTQGRTC